MLQRLGRAEEAEARVRKALALDPQLTFVRLLLGDLLRSKGQLGEARPLYRSILAKSPNDPDARFGRGFLNLLEGHLSSGWQDYEFRQARREPVEPGLTPQWRGEDPAGKTLLLYAEQGIGDTIQFLRYATLLARKGARVLVAVPTPVLELASRVEGVHEVVAPTYTLPPFHYCAPLPSLPLYCRTTLSDIPWDGAYLSPPAGRTLPTEPSDSEAKLTVALAWAGNPDHPNDHNRSLAVAEIKPLLQTEGIRWLILQKGAGASELDRRPDIIQLGSELKNFSEIATAICSADLTISVDTAFCHLAGALGRPVWTLLSYAPDWRWMLERTDAPWYPTMRLFRQSFPGDWAGVIAAVSQALAAHLSGMKSD